MHDHRRPTPERLGAFSDGVFAVIITIMVLELKPPQQSSFAALLSLWPTGLSYAVSYLFIAIVWVNHHHLLRFVEHATPRLIWWNFAHLFVVSLVPFSTAWIAVTRFAAVPVAVYAAIFVLVNSAYLAFAWEVLAQAEVQEKVSARTRQMTRVRSFMTLGIFVIAIVLSFKFPFWGFGLVSCVLCLVCLSASRSFWQTFVKMDSFVSSSYRDSAETSITTEMTTATAEMATTEASTMRATKASTSSATVGFRSCQRFKKKLGCASALILGFVRSVEKARAKIRPVRRNELQVGKFRLNNNSRAALTEYLPFAQDNS